MTSKLTSQAVAERLEVFPDFPPRDDMQNYEYLYLEGHPYVLINHFGDRDDVLVTCEAPVAWYPTRSPRIPDMTVVFGVNKGVVLPRRGYSIEEHGKPPDFVLEVASPTTARNDYTRKREDYASYGIPEYWRFDATGGQWYDAALAGDRLVGGVYRPIPINRSAEGHLWGHSDVLNLDLCWEEGRLRWRNPETGQYLLTHQEQVAGRVAAERRATYAEAGREAVQAQVAEVEAERDAYRAQAAEAEARVRQLEEEMRRWEGR